MSKVIINLSNKDYQDVCNTMAEWYGFKPTVSQAKRYLKNNRQLLFEIAEYGLDTAVREEVVEHFAGEIVGESWPCGAETNKSRLFFKKFQRAAKKANIEICGYGREA